MPLPEDSIELLRFLGSVEAELRNLREGQGRIEAAAREATRVAENQATIYGAKLEALTVDMRNQYATISQVSAIQTHLERRMETFASKESFDPIVKLVYSILAAFLIGGVGWIASTLYTATTRGVLR